MPPGPLNWELSSRPTDEPVHPGWDLAINVILATLVVEVAAVAYLLLKLAR